MPFAATDRALVERLDRCLPQTQCTRCGYPRCRDYAQAMARGEADINRCPPGDDVTIQLLADALGVATKRLDPSVGPHVARRRALIDESRCIGCAKCLDACPVDAIVGAYQWMHTVIASQCTGCELCVAPCPVDCIAMTPATRPAGEETPWPDYTGEEIDSWRAKTDARLARREARDDTRARTKGAARAREKPIKDPPPPTQMRDEIRAAIERVKRKRAAGSPRK